MALHVDSFSSRIAWLLNPFSLQQVSPQNRCDVVCSVPAAFVFLIGASVADDAAPTGSRVILSALVCRSLSALTLPPVSPVAGRCALPFRPARGAKAEAPLG
jgi:hypothetical protein